MSFCSHAQVFQCNVKINMTVFGILSESTQYNISEYIYWQWVNHQFYENNCLMKKGKGEIRFLDVGAKFYNVLKDVFIINKFKVEISSLSGESPSDTNLCTG